MNFKSLMEDNFILTIGAVLAIILIFSFVTNFGFTNYVAADTNAVDAANETHKVSAVEEDAEPTGIIIEGEVPVNDDNTDHNDNGSENTGENQ